MKTEIACVRCGEPFSSSEDLAGRQVRCLTCGLVQRIPDASESRPVVPGAYQLTPTTAVTRPVVAPQSTSAKALSPQRFRQPRFAWLEHLRPWVFETSQVQGIGACLVALSAADLFMTVALLRKSPLFFESNPIARWFFAQWNIKGMVFFKFSLIGGVILLSEIIERKRPGLGRFVLMIGCIGAAYAVYTGSRLYMSPILPVPADLLDDI
jgi:hypothetical protein